MTTTAISLEPPRPSFFNDPTVRGVIYQLVVAALVIGLFTFIISNAVQNLIVQRKTMGFDFLNHVSGFDIFFKLIPYDRGSSYWTAFAVGLLNTLLVAFTGIVLATTWGFILGIARLSSNVVISTLSAIYIETLRNIPLLLQLFFWYFAVLKAMPNVKQSYSFFDEVFVNKRGVFIPWPSPQASFVWVVVAFIVGLVTMIVWRRWAVQTRQATGEIPQAVSIARRITDALIEFLVVFAALYVSSFLVPELAPYATIPAIVAIAAIIALTTAAGFREVSRGVTGFIVGFCVSAGILGGLLAQYGAAIPVLQHPLVVEVVAYLLPVIGAGALGIAWYRNLIASPRAESAFGFSLSTTLLIGLPALVYVLLGGPLTFDFPVLKGFNYVGGVDLPPELVALIMGLVLYTATYIAEIVRGGILAVNKGQTEAAASLGLRDGDRLRLVVIPQALRVIIPPLTSQYLNLTKNSSLGAAIGFPELVNVFAGTALNQTGRAIEIISLTMLVYLTFSLSTSAIMNFYNARVALRER